MEIPVEYLAGGKLYYINVIEMKQTRADDPTKTRKIRCSRPPQVTCKNVFQTLFYFLCFLKVG